MLPEAYQAISSQVSSWPLQLVDSLKGFWRARIKAYFGSSSITNIKKGYKTDTRSSFNYLLLDPRLTKNLPLNHMDLTEQESWNVFLTAIFYVGKGTRCQCCKFLSLHVKLSQNTNAGSAKGNRRDHKSYLGRAFYFMFYLFWTYTCPVRHSLTPTSRVENSAQVLSCQLKFVQGQ